MGKFAVAGIAFRTFGSAAYAMGGGPYPHLLGQPDLHSPAMEGANPEMAPFDGYTAPYNSYSADLGATAPRRHIAGPRVRHWTHSSAH